MINFFLYFNHLLQFKEFKFSYWYPVHPHAIQSLLYIKFRAFVIEHQCLNFLHFNITLLKYLVVQYSYFYLNFKD